MASLSATNILSLAAFKARASEIINGMKADNRPIVITQNGMAAAVLIPPQEYDALVERADFLRAVEAGLADADAGRTISHEELAAEMKARYKA